MGTKSPAIVPPGCVTTALNKGKQGGDGRGKEVLVLARRQGTRSGVFELTAGRKETT